MFVYVQIEMTITTDHVTAAFSSVLISLLILKERIFGVWLHNSQNINVILYWTFCLFVKLGRYWLLKCIFFADPITHVNRFISEWISIKSWIWPFKPQQRKKRKHKLHQRKLRTYNSTIVLRHTNCVWMPS